MSGMEDWHDEQMADWDEFKNSLLILKRLARLERIKVDKQKVARLLEGAEMRGEITKAQAIVSPVPGQTLYGIEIEAI